MARKGKRKAQRRHAERRFAERLGIRLTQEHHAQLVRMIQAGELVAVRRTSLRCTVFEARLADLPGAPELGIDPGEKVHVVYDKNRKQVVTVTPATRLSDAIEELSQ